LNLLNYNPMELTIGNILFCWFMAGLIGYIILSIMNLMNSDVSAIKGIIRLALLMLLGGFTLIISLFYLVIKTIFDNQL